MNVARKEVAEKGGTQDNRVLPSNNTPEIIDAARALVERRRQAAPDEGKRAESGAAASRPLGELLLSVMDHYLPSK